MSAKFSDAGFPQRRFRRLRASGPVRDLLTETSLTPKDFLFPIFVQEGGSEPEPIASLPGMLRWPLDQLPFLVENLAKLGLRGGLLFPKIDPRLKTENGEAALDPEGIIPQALRLLKKEFPDFLLVTDVALDPFTTHGHDGILRADGKDVDNDATLDVLARMAVVQAEAGADWVAPSDMMDGRVGVIRSALDSSGLIDTAILAYSAKFASAYYGPFRDAVGSRRSVDAPPISKAGYQLNPANRREAIRDALADVIEGADLLMIKPAGPYLDIIRDLREQCDLPLVAYQVSGEYAMLHAAAEKGWLDLESCRDESLLGIKRAGTDLIISYFAADWARDFKSSQ